MQWKQWKQWVDLFASAENDSFPPTLTYMATAKVYIAWRFHGEVWLAYWEASHWRQATFIAEATAA